MEQDNHPSENEDIAILDPIKPLDNAEFKEKLLVATLQNNPEFFIEAAERNNLDGEKDKNLIADIVYKEQVMTLQSLCREVVLQENTAEAYNYLHAMSFFEDSDYAYIRAVEGENAAENLHKYIDERLKNVDDLKDTLSLIATVTEAYLYANADVPNFNAYKANQVLEKMNLFEHDFSDEQKAQSAYLMSKMFRKLEAGKKMYGDTCAVEKEFDCLRKVLFYTNDYKLLAYCQSRLDGKSEKEVIRAYKKALQKNKNKQALFNINMALAGIYEQQSKQIGFASTNSNKHLAAEKTVRYLTNAYRYSARADQMQILKQMADVHLRIGNIDEWKNLKTVIALKYLKGEARCWALNAIGDKMRDEHYYKMAIDECDKAKMPLNVKLDIKEITYAKMAEVSSSPQTRDACASRLQEVKSQKQEIFLSMLVGKKKSMI